MLGVELCGFLSKLESATVYIIIIHQANHAVSKHRGNGHLACSGSVQFFAAIIGVRKINIKRKVSHNNRVGLKLVARQKWVHGTIWICMHPSDRFSMVLGVWLDPASLELASFAEVRSNQDA